jgi:hypothetical protein
MSSNYELGGRRLIGRTEATRAVAEAELLKYLLIGFTLKEACQQMKCAYGTVRKLAKEPVFLLKLKEQSGEIANRLVDELSRSQVEMAQRLEEASSIALDEMLAMMGELPQGNLKYKICQDLLDRDPKSSRTKRMDLTGNMSHQFINPAVLIHAAATAKEIEKFQSPQIGEQNGDNAGHSPNS